jgi:hypothetical protein
MKRLIKADLEAAALAHCHEQTRIADIISGRQSERCEEACVSCMSAMREALKFVGARLGFEVINDESAAMH